MMVRSMGMRISNRILVESGKSWMVCFMRAKRSEGVADWWARRRGA